MTKPNELIIQVVERYLYHKSYKSDNPVVLEMRKSILDVEITEMWMLTQSI